MVRHANDGLQGKLFEKDDYIRKIKILMNPNEIRIIIAEGII